MFAQFGPSDTLLPYVDCDFFSGAQLFVPLYFIFLNVNSYVDKSSGNWTEDLLNHPNEHPLANKEVIDGVPVITIDLRNIPGPIPVSLLFEWFAQLKNQVVFKVLLPWNDLLDPFIRSVVENKYEILLKDPIDNNCRIIFRGKH